MITTKEGSAQFKNKLSHLTDKLDSAAEKLKELIDDTEYVLDYDDEAIDEIVELEEYISKTIVELKVMRLSSEDSE